MIVVPSVRGLLGSGKSFSPSQLTELQLWLKADAGVTTTSTSFVNQTILGGADIGTSNGTYTRSSGGTTQFLGPNGNYIYWDYNENGWLLFDDNQGFATYINYSFDLTDVWYVYAGSDPAPTGTNSNGTWDVVSSWADQSGNGNDAISVIDKQPVFQNAGSSAVGHDCLYFDAGGSYSSIYNALTVSGGPFDSVTDCTIFVVARQLVAGPYANGNFFGQTGGNDDCPTTARRKFQMTSGYMLLNGCEGDYNGGVDPNIGENYLLDFPFTLYGVRPDSSNGEAKITTIFQSNWTKDDFNGPVSVNAGRYDYTGTLSRGAIEAFGVPAGVDVMIGSAFFGGSENHKGEICEIVFYSRALTDTEFDQVIDYLNNKYSVYLN